MGVGFGVAVGVGSGVGVGFGAAVAVGSGVGVVGNVTGVAVGWGVAAGCGVGVGKGVGGGGNVTGVDVGRGVGVGISAKAVATPSWTRRRISPSDGVQPANPKRATRVNAMPSWIFTVSPCNPVFPIWLKQVMR